jgi:hypothetical protein
MASEIQRFRELMKPDEIVIQPSIYDGYSAGLEKRAIAIREMEQRFLTATRKAAKYVTEAIG